MIQSLLALLPGTVKLGADIINRPQKEDFAANTGYLERYMSNLKGANRGTGQRVTRPLFKEIRSQNRETDRNIQSAVGRGDLSSSEEAQLKITQGQAATGSLQKVGEKSADIQAEADRRTGLQVNQALAQISQIKEQSRLDFKRARRDSNKRIGTDLVALGATALSGGLSKIANTKSSFEAAKATGFGGTLDDYKLQSKDFTNKGEFNRMLGLQENIRSTIVEHVPGVNADDIANIRTKADATRFIRDARVQQGKDFRSIAGGEITEEILNNATTLSETQKNQLFVKSLGGDTDQLTLGARQMLIDARNPATTPDEYSVKIVEAIANGASKKEIALFEAADAKLRTRVKAELKAGAQNVYDVGPAGKVAKLNFAQVEVASELSAWHKAFGGGLLPQVFEEKLKGTNWESLSPQTLQSLIDGVDQMVGDLEMPDIGESEMMQKINAMAIKENLDLGAGDDEDKLKEFRLRMAEKFKDGLTRMAGHSLNPVNEDVPSRVQPLQAEEDEEPAEEVEAPTIGAPAPQQLDLSPSEKATLSKSFPGQEKAFVEYTSLDPQTRAVLDVLSSYTVDQLSQLDREQLIEMKDELFAIGLIDTVTRTLDKEDIEALRTIRAFQASVGQPTENADPAGLF